MILYNASPVAIYGAQRLLVYTLLMNTILDYTVTNIVQRSFWIHAD